MNEIQKKMKVQKYSCESTPTIRKFHNDDDFVRGIMGPIGSGKSTACVMEILMRSMAQAPASDGIRYTRWAVVRNCYDDKTEILTEKRGFQLFKDLNKTDKVATLVDDKIKYQLPERVHSAPYKGEMIGFENEGVDFLVTPDHKMYVSKCKTRKQVWGPFEEKTAEEIYGSCKYRVKRDAQWDGAKQKYTPDMFEWLGFWFAEGCVGVGQGRRRLNVTQNETNQDYVIDLFNRAGILFSQNHRADKSTQFRVSLSNDLGNELFELLKDCGLQPKRAVPLWIKNAPIEHLRRFLEGFIEGDGHVLEGGSTFMSTSSEQLANDIQEIALKAGRVANIAFRDRRGKKLEINGVKSEIKHIEYTVTLLGKKKHAPKLYTDKNKKTNNKRKGWHKVDYDGFVYCVEMPIVPVYVRRNGKAFWCFRTYPELRTTTLKTWNTWCPAEYGALTIGSPIRHHVRTKDMDMEVYFMPLDGDEDVRKVLSLEVTGVWINEAREIQKSILDALTGRVGRYPAGSFGKCTWSGVIMDTNPPDDQSWWYRMSEEERPKDWKFYKQPSGDSQHAENLPNLPDKYYERTAQGKDPDWVKVYVKGQYGFVTEGRPVFPSYRDRIHASDTALSPIPGVPLLIGVDFGLTPAAVVGQKLVDGRWLILDEFCTEDTGIVRFAQTFSKYLRSTFPDFEIQGGWGDPAGKTKAGLYEDTAFDIMNEYFPLDRWGANSTTSTNGVRWRPAPTNDVGMRLEAVKVTLDRLIDGNPGILVAPRCKLIRKGFAGGYHYKFVRPGSDQTHEHPVKNRFSHPMDALQYLLLGGGEHNVVLRKVDRARETRSTSNVVKGLDYKIFG